jgi:hypothetical protein
MAQFKLTIDSIFEGQGPSSNFVQTGQFLSSIAIDPDAPTSDGSTDLKPSGFIRPVGYAKFSDTVLDQVPMWIITNPKNTTTYVFGNAGDIVSYASALTSASETLLETVGTSIGNGAAYYNNYIYYASNTDVGRYGPLDGSPAFDDDFWTSALSLTALTNTTYPATRHSVKFPNHVMKAHVDNKLYFADVYDGKGILSAIKTKKTTAQGDTTDGSSYNVLDFPYDYLPMCIESYGENLAIGCSFGTSSVVNQGSSILFIWDTISDSFSRLVPVPDQVVTALKYQNGILYGWSGNLSGGTRFWVYLGGDSIQTLKYIPDAIPPLAGAIEADANRIMWGGFTVYPVASASVFAYGSKSDLFPRGLHNIARSSVTATASNGVVTALKNVLQDSKSHPNLVIGSTDGTLKNLDKRSTAYQTSVFRSRPFEIGAPFTVKRIRIPLAQAVAANMTIVPKLYFDCETSSQVGTTINSTNYADSEKFIILGPENFVNNTSGSNSFFLEFTISGTALSTIGLPIEIEIETDEKD